MRHIDHNFLSNQPPPPPEPAAPILASHLLELEEKQHQRFERNGGSGRLSTGCRDIDELLGGGIERGVVLGLSSSVEGFEGRLLSLHILASALIPRLASSKPGTKATIIDTTGSFPVALFYSILRSRILANRSQSAQNTGKPGNHPVQRPTKDGGGTDLDADLQRCLEMVAISRVFDIEGLWEVLGEIQQDISSEVSPKGGLVPGRGSSGHEGDLDLSPEIFDSQEEDLMSEDGLPIPSPAPKAAGPGDVQCDEVVDGIEFIIIDNMTHIMNELFARKERSDAHSLLTPLSSTLHTLTKTRNLLTILHNTTTTTAAPTKVSYQPQPNRQQLHTTTQKSIFASPTTKPAFGQVFSQFPDLHIFLHDLPRGRVDAEILYGQDEESSLGETDAVTCCTVVEVLKDECPLHGSDRDIMTTGQRFGWREQRWTAVEINEAGTDLVATFLDGGGGGRR
ncbi:uncharacterized protein L3040_000232 [Drepanopeziza brunnea f. sp. 'multigermtubi']|uniref:uncharacterized protein n=1 Tax=Drepanopeziza brunnea f. sp. 'multigermtubi' TaxID=698441 RepID=UPI0023A28C0B|nr:hypothetical protein L3040_000232 [Drepanopeziza brunnea f. sp. 'multigermtubi']